MKKLVACLSILILALFCYADFKLEVTQKFKKGKAEITIAGRTVDEVRVGTARTLIRLKCKLVEKDEDIGLIVAQRKKVKESYNDERAFVSSREYVSDRWEIMIESVDDEVIVTCSYVGEGAGFWGSKKKSFEDFCTKLKNILRREK